MYFVQSHFLIHETVLCTFLLKLLHSQTPPRLMLGLKIYVKNFLGKHFHLGGRRSDDGIRSWSDGSAWSYENFVNEEQRNTELRKRLILQHTKKWGGIHETWNDTYNYLCQYTL